MDSVAAALLKLALPAGAIVAMLVAARLRLRLSWRNDLGFAPVAPGTLALWLLGWCAWLAIGEQLIDLLELDQARPWPPLPALAILIRILAIGVAGPMAEELLFRGILLSLLSRTRVGTEGAVVIAAAGWAALHAGYGFGTVALIAADGLLLGAARVHSRSLWVPIAMHAGGNLFSIWQSLQA